MSFQISSPYSRENGVSNVSCNLLIIKMIPFTF